MVIVSPATLPPFSYTLAYATGTLPAGSQTIYASGGDSTVAVIPFGSGKIVSFYCGIKDIVPVPWKLSPFIKYFFRGTLKNLICPLKRITHLN